MYKTIGFVTNKYKLYEVTYRNKSTNRFHWSYLVSPNWSYLGTPHQTQIRYHPCLLCLQSKDPFFKHDLKLNSKFHKEITASLSKGQITAEHKKKDHTQGIYFIENRCRVLRYRTDLIVNSSSTIRNENCTI